MGGNIRGHQGFCLKMVQGFEKLKTLEAASHSHHGFCLKGGSCFQKIKPPESAFHGHQGICGPKKLMSWHARSCSWHAKRCSWHAGRCSWHVRRCSWHVGSLCSRIFRSLKNPQPESCHLGEKKMVSGHETDISEDLPAK